MCSGHRESEFEDQILGLGPSRQTTPTLSQNYQRTIPLVCCIPADLGDRGSTLREMPFADKATITRLAFQPWQQHRSFFGYSHGWTDRRQQRLSKRRSSGLNHQILREFILQLCFPNISWYNANCQIKTWINIHSKKLFRRVKVWSSVDIVKSTPRFVQVTWTCEVEASGHVGLVLRSRGQFSSLDKKVERWRGKTRAVFFVH